MTTMNPPVPSPGPAPGVPPPLPEAPPGDVSATPRPSPPAQSRAEGIFGSLTKDNPYFSAGFGLMGIGVVLAVLRKGAVLGASLVQRRMLVTLEMTNKDRAYDYLLSWMAQRQAEAQVQMSAGRGLFSLSPTVGGKGKGEGAVRWLRSHDLSVQTTLSQRKNGSVFVDFGLVAGPGTHYFQYEGAWMQLKRERETRATSLMDARPFETLTLTTLSRDRVLFPRLLSEARDASLEGQQGKLVVYTAWNTEWKPFGMPRQKRPLESVVLAEGVSERIELDLRDFLHRRQWYADRGIPYRRGYLLHGPPGSGKSSFIQALAGHFSYDICLLNMSERGFSDDKLHHQLANVPEHSIVLIEDVDAAFNKRVQTSEDGYQSGVTFSGFLNALDGVAAGEQRIVFLTTNHLDALDPALIRPGRVDFLQLVDDALPEQAQRLFTRFYGGYPEIEEEAAKNLGEEMKLCVEEAMGRGRRMSMAALQGLFIRCGPEEAVRECRTLLAGPRT